MLLQRTQCTFSSSTCWQREGRREKGEMEDTNGGVFQPQMGDGQRLPHQQCCHVWCSDILALLFYCCIQLVVPGVQLVRFPLDGMEQWLMDAACAL